MTDKITPEKIAELREVIARQEYNLPLRSGEQDQTEGYVYLAKRGRIFVDAQYWGGLCKYIVISANMLPTLLDEIERLRSALDFYANVNIYDEYAVLWKWRSSVAESDSGKVAREALGGSNE